MKKVLLSVIIMMISLTVMCQEVKREGNTFSRVSTEKTVSKEQKTQYEYKDSKGNVYPIYIGTTGSCYIKKVSKKTGKEYKQYLGEQISSQICKEMGLEYKPKNK